MTNGPRNDEVDIDRTDELPVLSPERIEAISKAERTAGNGSGTDRIQALTPGAGKSSPDTADKSQIASGELERLARDVASLGARWQDVESVLSANAAGLAKLRAELADSRRELHESQARQQALLARLASRSDGGAPVATEAAAEPASDADQSRSAKIDNRQQEADRFRKEAGELTASLAYTRERMQALDAALKASREREARLKAESAKLIAEVARLQNGAAPADEPEAPAADAAQPAEDDRARQSLLQKIDGLESYIAGRKERWAEMEAGIVDRDEQIRELQDELAYRAREHEALEAALTAEKNQAERYRARVRALERQQAREGARRATPSRPAVQSDDVDSAAAAATGQNRATTQPPSNAGQTTQLLAVENLQPVTSAAAIPAKQPAGNSGSAPANDAGGRPPRALRPPALVCLTSDKAVRHDVLKSEMSIGRGEDCDIRIMTHFVSRKHARLRRLRDGSVLIEDCGSTNGVFVNSVRVDRVKLENGDWVTIGEMQFRYSAMEERDS